MTSTHTPTTQSAHTNRLIRATSPYLLQHAHNPVDWYEWGPEALKRAKDENKPIFLSIGYSACHWCHVMERECFENEAIAAVMNEHFVCIKVDREERPDLDDIYMSATQALTRSGGWPMSVWLTPDLRPFYAGTYFPPESSHGRPGFKDVLLFLHEAWKDKHDQVIEQANALTDAVRQITSTQAGGSAISVEVITQAAELIARQFDASRGGVSSGGTNKFPPSMAMDLMLRAYDRSLLKGKPNQMLLDRVETTLENMAYGGIYDQLGGGISRYSTDPDWLVPHFEKMLYDQALVSDIYLDAYRLTKKPLYAETARSILDYVIADLQSPEGGFYSARDADSEGVEGKFYVWSKTEVEGALGDDATIFCDYYDITDGGNWEGHNILNVPNEPAVVAAKHGISQEVFDRRIAAAREKLLAIRAKRVPPFRDDKVLAAWNGLMIASMAKAGRVLNEPRYIQSAIRAADFVLLKMTDETGRLLRTYRNQHAHTPGYLDDYAMMIDASLNLFETTFDRKWLDAAERLNAIVIKHYRDESGGFFFTADDAETVLVRMKSASDNAVPSGNAVQAMNLLRLGVLLDRDEFRSEAEKLLMYFGDKAQSMPFSSERLLAAADFLNGRPKEIAIVCRRSGRSDADAMIDAIWRNYVPNFTMALLVEDDVGADALRREIPLLKDKKSVDEKATAYVCENYACRAPTSDIQTLMDQVISAKIKSAP
ncbi:MAG: thioredoxin domain-containing protein [Phycisphaerales bacterium]|nr:thioredoxin domain-containing protein [Phycisphaerales bacterium]